MNHGMVYWSNHIFSFYHYKTAMKLTIVPWFDHGSRIMVEP